jgi:hypothetical protein
VGEPDSGVSRNTSNGGSIKAYDLDEAIGGGANIPPRQQLLKQTQKLQPNNDVLRKD